MGLTLDSSRWKTKNKGGFISYPHAKVEGCAASGAVAAGSPLALAQLPKVGSGSSYPLDHRARVLENPPAPSSFFSFPPHPWFSTLLRASSQRHTHTHTHHTLTHSYSLTLRFLTHSFTAARGTSIPPSYLSPTPTLPYPSLAWCRTSLARPAISFSPSHYFHGSPCQVHFLGIHVIPCGPSKRLAPVGPPLMRCDAPMPPNRDKVPCSLYLSLSLSLSLSRLCSV